MTNQNYLLWQYVELEPEQHPARASINPRYIIDLNHTDLPKEEPEEFGVKTASIWYATHDAENGFQTPLARVERETTFDPVTRLPNPIVKSLSYVYEDGTWSEPQSWTEPIKKPKKFLKTMRSRAIDELEDLAAQFDFRPRILEIYEEFQSEVALFVEAGSPKFRDAIVAAEHEWLDITNPATGNKPREVIILYASIGLQT